MKDNICTLDAEVGITILCLLAELKHLTMFIRKGSRAEFALYDALEEIIRNRTDPRIIKLVDERNVIERASHDLRQYGIDVWELCGLRQKDNK